MLRSGTGLGDPHLRQFLKFRFRSGMRPGDPRLQTFFRTRQRDNQSTCQPVNQFIVLKLQQKIKGIHLIGIIPGGRELGAAKRHCFAEAWQMGDNGLDLFAIDHQLLLQ
jgi:hypothetical protein